MVLFYKLYQQAGLQVLYCTVQDKFEFLWHVKKNADEKIFMFYHYKEQLFTTSNICLIYSELDISGFLAEHNVRHFKNPEQIIEQYDLVHDPPLHKMSLSYQHHALNMVANVKKSIMASSVRIEYDNNCKDNCKNHRNYLSKLIQTYLPDLNMDFIMGSYSFEQSNRIHTSQRAYTLTLHDVFYMNKQWYDKDKNPMSINEFQRDFEYSQFKGSPDSSADIVHISEEVIFLDYIYGCYNFGEFWDVINRLIACDKKRPVFYCARNRVTDFEYYFNELGYPLKYVCETNKMYHFDTIHISIIEGCYRGYYNRFDAYRFNMLLNKEPPIDTSYVLYLSRGSFGRSLHDEGDIIQSIQAIHPTIVITGAETHKQMLHYFTNAKLILGVHGSLMKNLIWCKKSPIFIELCPYTRHGCFVGNSLNIGFQTFFFIVDCNDKEQITLSDKQKQGLFRLLEVCLHPL